MKKLGRAAPKPVVHKIASKDVGPALHKAQVPARFVRPEVKLTAFPWGLRVKGWLDTVLPEQIKDNKSALVSGPADHAIPVCAMIARTLVVRGHDAVFTSLAELVASKESIRRSEYLVIAGFYDASFDKIHGMPMTSEKCHYLSWALWRLANDGTTIIAYVSPSMAGLGKWWAGGAINNMFDPGGNFQIERT